MKQLSMDDLLMEKSQSYATSIDDVDTLFNNEVQYAADYIESVPKICRNVELKEGVWIRLYNGCIYKIVRLAKPSKVFQGMKKFKRKDGTYYYKRDFKEELCVEVRYFNQSVGKEVSEYIYQTDIQVSSFFILDCIFKGDIAFTDLGTVMVCHKIKYKKSYVLDCLQGNRRIVLTEKDKVYGFDNSIKRGNIMRTLSINDKVKDRFHGWGMVVDVLPHKVHVESPNFKRMYILSEKDIIDYRYADGT